MTKYTHVLMFCNRLTVTRLLSRQVSTSGIGIRPVSRILSSSAYSEIKMAGGREELMKFLSDIEVTPEIIEHPEVFTVEAMMPYLGDCEGAVSKNLFLKDKKKKLFLASVLAEKSVNLSELSKQVGASGGLRFADEAIMVEKLGVAQGCCTALALFNDKEHNVRFVLDSEFFNGAHKNVYFHPMVNTQTAGLKTEDFRKFLKATGHEPIIVNL